MQASPNTKASFWSHTMYRDPKTADPDFKRIKVHYCKTKEVGETVAKYFLNEKVIGFDIEWKYDFRPADIKENASLIQIACENRIALFHISLYKGKTADELLPPTLKTILESPDIAKVGVAIRGDFTRCWTYLGIKACHQIELSRLHNLVEYRDMAPKMVNNKLVGMAKQVQTHLQLPLAKGDVRKSDWSKPLTTEQVEYAASDAYAGFRIYDVLEMKRKAMKPVPTPPAPFDWD
ncbi:ribonuclease H-like protein, partial [Amniculicola lignicola CBS 123094]